MIILASNTRNAFSRFSVRPEQLNNVYIPGAIPVRPLQCVGLEVMSFGCLHLGYLYTPLYHDDSNHLSFIRIICNEEQVVLKILELLLNIY